jgi:DNA-binding transcriptional ArsR family regulator
MTDLRSGVGYLLTSVAPMYVEQLVIIAVQRHVTLTCNYLTAYSIKAVYRLPLRHVKEMDEVFKALADPNRRRLLDSLNAHNGQSLRQMCTGLEMTRQSVSKHLAVLEAANLVIAVWRGREKLHYLNSEPINAVADRWMSQYGRGRVASAMGEQQWDALLGVGK